MEGSYKKLKKDVLNATGVDLNSYKEKQMKRRINSLISRNDIDSYNEYVRALKEKKEIYEEFLNYFTINVSEFFRNPNQWEIFEKEILKEYIEKNKVPKVWSAACSTGDEPYTVAMILSKYFPANKIKIKAVDIDKTILEKAKMGIYSERSVKNVPDKYLNKFFEKSDKFYKVKSDIKKCIDFKQADLLKDKYPAKNDIIICRNVLIYFTEDAKNKIYDKFNDALVPGGVLFVGNTEQIINPEKHNFNSLKTFFYKKNRRKNKWT